MNKAAHLLKRDMYQLMLFGGEDYELIFTAPDESSDSLESLATDTGVAITRIGIIDAKKGVRTVQRFSGEQYSNEIDISFRGFDHFAGDLPDLKR